MATSISWDLYRSFLAVLEAGSLSGAARVLETAQPTVGRHVAALEQSLGLPLFTRSQLGLAPTEAAQALRAFVQEMSGTAAALERTAASQGSGVRGVVRVTASELVGIEVLPPIVARLRESHPDLRLELALSNRVQDLLHREADIAVRMAPPQQGALVAQRIGRVELGLYAHERYVAQRGTPRKVEQLAGHALIGFDSEPPYVRSALASLPAGLRTLSRESFALRSDSDLAQLALLRCGAGIGVCQVPLANLDPALLRVLPTRFSMHLDAWVTMHEDLRHSPRCRVAFDALAAGLRDYLG